MKECSKCGEVKALSAFYFRKERNMYNSFCKECFKVNSDRWYAENSKHRCKVSRKWEAENRDRCNFNRRVRRKSEYHRAVSCHHSAVRRAKKRKSYINLSKEEKLLIKKLYMQAKELGMHVDHIKPISKGGEHRLINLQLLTPEENLRKGAKYEEPQ